MKINIMASAVMKMENVARKKRSKNNQWRETALSLAAYQWRQHNACMTALLGRQQRQHRGGGEKSASRQKRK